MVAELAKLIQKIHTKSRTGIDVDKNVISAAKFRSLLCLDLITKYQEGSVQELKNYHSIDVLIMVNWTHNIPSDILTSWMNNEVYNSLSDSGVLFIDSLSNNTYQFNHDIESICFKNYKVYDGSELFEFQRKIFALTRK